MNFKSRLLKKMGIEREFRIDIGDKIVVAKCNVVELLATKDPDKACTIVKIIEKQTSNKQNKEDNSGESNE